MNARRAEVVVRVELPGIEPLIWRRVRVAQFATFKELHEILPRMMGVMGSKGIRFKSHQSRSAQLHTIASWGRMRRRWQAIDSAIC